ncbi:MAG: polysaccharide biosynthesis protein [Lentimicrobiaceae bacterium]|nr:polysaccharide biosynthesis protein [Lentimicrobiaceae bacterium]
MTTLSIRNLRFVPAVVVWGIDLCVVFVATMLAVLFRDSVTGFTHISTIFTPLIPITILGIRAIFFLIFKIQKIVVRYTNSKDAIKIFLATLSGTVTLFILTYSFWMLDMNMKRFIPVSIIGMEFFITTTLMVIYRFIIKIYFLERINPKKLKKNIVIVGAGTSGITTKRALDRDAQSKYNVLAFFDDDPKKQGMQLENMQVRAMTQLDEYLMENEVSFLIISIQNLPARKKNQIAEIALKQNVKVLIVPPVTHWINGELSFKQIKKIKIEELLERDPIDINKSLVNKDIVEKTILITGAAGSIGSEIVRQLLKFNFKKLILLDNAETPLFFLQQELIGIKNWKNIDMLLADVTNVDKMEEIMELYKPEIVYHAAAYKHVQLMEDNVHAAVKNNVEGTKIIADLAVKYGVIKFVMISTDKAVNPTGVMGASKRIAEIYVQSLNFNQKTTKFITTRFGNVLGSNGSVIPIFKEQIENGGPITITHPDITRYFMTIHEACQLVITAGAMGEGGEIFIFDMGESVKIYDLAVKMIKLSGLILGKDIKIEFTGLRPGEKLYEELLANAENTKPTPHQQIMIAEVRRYKYEDIENEITNLIISKNRDPLHLVKLMKNIVPEYISMNSKYECLDN